MTYELHLALLILSIAVVYACMAIFVYGAANRQLGRTTAIMFSLFAPFLLWPAIVSAIEDGLLFRNPHRKADEK